MSRELGEPLVRHAILFGIGLSIDGAFAALFDAFRLGRARAASAALSRLVPLLLSAALGFGTLVLLIAAIAPCLD
jgi:hypothetical protein